MIKKIIQDIEFWKLLISVTTPVLVALIGLWVFKKQGQHNLIRKRYLEEGFDQLIDEYEKAMFTYRHNWALSIEVLRQIKNLPKEFVSENSINEFIGLGPQVLPTTAVHRVNKIFNNKKLWELHQALFLFVQQNFYLFEYHFKVAIQIYLKESTDTKLSSNEIYDQYLKVFKEMDKNSEKFSAYIGCIKMLSTIIEKNIYNMRSLKNIKKNKNVIKAFKKINSF